MERYSTLQQVQSALATGELTCCDLVNYFLAQIEASRHLNIYIEVYAEEALAKAKVLDQKYATSSTAVGRLFGMVIAIKDVICYESHAVTAASKILQGFVAPYSATAIERLLAEDAIIIGRANCDEFAMGSTNENSYYGITRNAADENKVPGGSSGASAVAVQAGTCIAALGSDTGGSVRQPAGLCGVVGMKPTYGRISRHGLIAYGSSFDQIGTLTNNVEDAALLLEIMAGADEFDSTASQSPVPLYSERLKKTEKYKVAYFKSAVEHEKLDTEIQQRTFQFIQQLQKAGHQVEAIEFDYLDYLIPAYYVLTTAEASSNLSRYDGIRYGYRSPNASNLLETYTKSRTEGFSLEVKRRIMLGTFVLSAGYYEAYYTKAQQIRQLLWQRTKEIFNDFDFILMPVSPTTAWEIGKLSNDPVEMYLSDIFTVHANMVGIPALALPIGTHSNGLPIGVQLMANRFEEEKLLAMAYSIPI
ncbi:MAG: Asp-tRNA(Asn)/Glu-tRNA(Gln) amidotransferase subunit GatA [Saprospiraceae bacterium]|nr:Asp-tRNA(Asn)/Glu-tRNA(Gln) amidotransferase subunit GatA [Saprospiraceae bacterium]